MISSINSQSIPNLGKYSMREQHLHNKSQERFSLVENVPLANHRNRNFDETLKTGKRGSMVRSQKRNYNNWSMSSFDKVSWVSQRKNWKCYINPQVNKYYTQIVKRMKSEGSDRSNKNELDQFERQERLKNISFMNQPQIQSKIEKTSVGTSVKVTQEAQTQTQVNNKEVDVKKYETRIDVLEHQNTNLKDQLFYLRQAILARYELFNQTKQRK